MCDELPDAAGRAAAAPHPAGGPAADPISLLPVDEVTVTTPADNVFDALLVSSGLSSGDIARHRNGDRPAVHRRLDVGRAPGRAQILPTVATLTEVAPALIVPGHCTGGRAQRALAAALPDAWVPSSSGSSYRLAAAS